jgi:hypothetical protein
LLIDKVGPQIKTGGKALSDSGGTNEIRQCKQCGAVLSSYTTGSYCRPCSSGEIQIPDFVISLVESSPELTSYFADILRKGMLAGSDEVRKKALLEVYGIK